MEHLKGMKKIDSDWFKDRIGESPYQSQRQFAKAMSDALGKPFDQSALVRILSSERGRTDEEVVCIAHLLNVSVLEVLKRLGFHIKKTGHIEKI